MPSPKTIERDMLLASPDYDLISGPHQFRLLKTRIKELVLSKGPFGLDTETGGPGKKDGLLPWRGRVRLIQIATKNYCLIVDLDGWRPNEPHLHPGVPWHQPGLAELKFFLESKHRKIIQNAPFDLTWLRTTGVVVGGLIFDTMIGGKLINAGTNYTNDLGALAKRYLNIELDKTHQRFDFNQPELPVDVLEYAAKDAVILTLLAQPIRKRLHRESLWEIFQLEMDVLRPIAEMRWQGFGVDLEAALKLKADFVEKEDALKLLFIEMLDQKLQLAFPTDTTRWIPRDPDGAFNLRTKDSGKVRDGTKKLKGFNISSTYQVGEALQNCGVVLPLTSTGKPSLDKKFLAFVEVDQDSFPENAKHLIFAYKEYKTSSTLLKHITTIIDAIEVDSRIHASFNQLGADTGRMSCSQINLQQIPSKPPHGPAFRSLFRARSGYYLVIADFGQIEIRVAASISGEQAMINAYKKGRDLHTETAARMTGRTPEEMAKLIDSGDKWAKNERSSAKIVNFGLLFGAGPATLQSQAVCQFNLNWTLAESKERVEAFRDAYPTFYKWQTEVGNQETFSIFTKLGRRRMTSGIRAQYTGRLNTPIQGTAGDITKLSIRNIWKDILSAPNKECYLIGVCHDEIILEVKEGTEQKWMKLLSHAMVSGGEELIKDLPIVADADYGKTWADAK